MQSELATILISHHKLPDKWLDNVLKLLPEKINIQIFFVDAGTLLVGKKLVNIPLVKLVYCAHSHRVLNGPNPLANIEAGGLLDLGKMVGKSDYFLSVPHTFKPIKAVTKTQKNIGITIDKNSKLAVEALRVATGLAGCNHRVTIFYPKEISQLINKSPKTPAEAKLYLEALTQLGAKLQNVQPSYDSSECDFIIGI
ncbi:MAG: hypothetical protein HQL68_12355 [Magnetococcales bacterium]|nr:hypothetical protein [Magnetococcales bacterium]